MAGIQSVVFHSGSPQRGPRDASVAGCPSRGRAQELQSNPCRREAGERIMASYGPELIQTMRAVLEGGMTKIPVDQVTPRLKPHTPAAIFKAAPDAQPSYP